MMVSLVAKVSLFAVLFCMIWVFLVPWMTSSQTCSEDPVVRIPWTFFPSQANDGNPRALNLSTCEVFSESYYEARQHFRSAVQALGTNVTLESLLVVEATDTNNYTMDVAVIPGSCPGLVVHVSGTHGIEGYAGSAIQVAFLRGLAQQENVSLVDEVRDPFCSTIVLVHAFNPYGMAHYRRVNENNVDLNRNGILSNLHWDKVLHGKHFNTGNYDTIVGQYLLPPTVSVVPSNAFLRRLWISFWLEKNVYSWIRMLRALLRFGIPQIKAALVGGQYHAPNGLFYGGGNGGPSGPANEPSLLVLRDWMEQFLRQRRNSVSYVDECVTWIDVHTGLGPMGMDTLLFASTMKPPDDANDVQRWFPSALVSNFSSPKETAANAVAQGYEEVVGLTIDYYSSTLWKENVQNTGRNASARHLFMVQEFGTVPSPITGHALVVEHVAYQKYRSLDPTMSEQQKISDQHSRETLGNAFYPQNAKWRRDILQRGILCLQQAIRRSSVYSSYGKTSDLGAAFVEPTDVLSMDDRHDEDSAKAEL